MSLRRSRTLILAVTIILLHLVVISLIKYTPDSKVHALLESNFDQLKASFLDRQSDKVDFSKFNTKLMNKFDRVYRRKPIEEIDDPKVRMQLFGLDMSNDEKFNRLTLPLYLKDSNSDMKPPLQHFDPRFTFSLLLHYISTTTRYENPESLELPYFHWSDYIDLSTIDEYFLNPKKKDCQDFDFTTASSAKNNRLELFAPEQFCFDDKDIASLLERNDLSPEFKQQLEIIKNNRLSTGFHVFAPPGRSGRDIRPIMSKSYLHDFMPQPLSMNLLLPGDKNIFLRVNQDIPSGKKKLMDTRILGEYKWKYMSDNKAELDVSNEVYLDVKNEMTELQDTLNANPHIVSEQKKLTYERHLSPEQFVDHTDRYLSKFEEMKSNSTISVIQEHYLNSIKASEATDSPAKYFSEAKIIQSDFNSDLGGHYDWRFFNGIINYTDLHGPALFGLIRAWLRFSNAHGVSTWIAHGSLLSWYWNGMAFPWDNDIDIQMPVDELHKLAQKFNQSIIVDFGDDITTQEIRYGRYFLDIGTFISHRTYGNGNNNIDARFIDMETGVYIDITGLALTNIRSPDRYNKLLIDDYDRKNRAMKDIDRNEHIQVYNCRNNHFSLLDELSPLKMTSVEGQLAYVPNNFEQLLVDEYGDKGLASYSFKAFEYIPHLRQWLKQRDLTDFFKEHHVDRAKDRQGQPAPQVFTDEDFIKLLFDQEDALFEYLVTTDATEFHENEIISLIGTGNASEHFFNSKGELTFEPFQIRHDYFTYKARKENYNFENEVSKTIEQVSEYEADLKKYNDHKSYTSTVESQTIGP